MTSQRKIVELRNEFLNSRKEVQKLKLDAAEVETHAKQTTHQVDQQLKGDIKHVDQEVAKFISRQKAENSRLHA